MSSSHDAIERLASVDLNLVVLFDALARERSVTRAAHRIGVTQSAVSHALRRLRELFGDPLLVRGRGGMVLTPRAEALVVPLRSGLVSLGRALAEPPEFEPATARRAFTLATPDLFDVLVIPALLAQIRKSAPGVDIAIVPLDPQKLGERLETGEIDAAITPRIDDTSELVVPGLFRRKLFRDRFACLLRASHPALGKRSTLTLASYAELSHVLVSPSGAGDGLVDRALERRGLARRIALRVPYFYAALAIVAKSDLVLTAPAPLVRLADARSVTQVEPPLALPQHDIHLTWHERFTHDPGHRWFRELVATVAIETVAP
jgi:DNA-binding transcriptional LysR family regulator